jgi:hypothetical protein
METQKVGAAVIHSAISRSRETNVKVGYNECLGMTPAPIYSVFKLSTGFSDAVTNAFTPAVINANRNTIPLPIRKIPR